MEVAQQGQSSNLTSFIISGMLLIGVDEDAITVEGADPLAGLSERKKKLYQLKQKLRECRKANQHAVLAENKRKQVQFSLAFHGCTLILYVLCILAESGAMSVLLVPLCMLHMLLLRCL